MKILYHNRTQMGDAQGIHVQEIVKAFTRLGHSVRLLSLVSSGNAEKSRVRILGRVVRHTPSIIYEILALCYNLVSFHRIRRLTRSFRPDFIYERYSLFSFGGLLAARRCGIPFCLEVNAPLYLEHRTYGNLVLGFLARRIENWVCSHSHVTIVVSSVLRDILQRQGVSPRKITVMPNGIDPREFRPDISGCRVREKMGLGGHDRVIGVVGWFRPWHGLDLLIESLHANRILERSNVFVLLLGDGPAIPACRAAVEKLDLERRVILTGAVRREEIPEHIAALDIAVQPRATEYACPMKVIEYLAMGKAIVAPRQPNLLDVLEHGRNSLLFRPEDGGDLSAQIATLLDNYQLRRRLSENAVQTIHLKRLSWEENGRRVVEMMHGFRRGVP